MLRISTPRFSTRIHQVVGVAWFSLRGSPKLHRVLPELDTANRPQRALIQLGDPTWHLQIRNQRWFVGEDWYSQFDRIRQSKRRGRDTALFVAVPQHFVENGRAKVILDSYVSISQWNSITFDESTIFCAQNKNQCPRSPND